MKKNDNLDFSLDELDALDENDLLSDEIVEITDVDGISYECYFLGKINYKGLDYLFFKPAELIDGVDEDEILIFEQDGDNNVLLDVCDETLYAKLIEEFAYQYKGEYIEDECNDEIQLLN